MNDEPTNQSGTGSPLPPPDPTERADEFWGPAESAGPAGPHLTAARGPRRRSTKTWIAAGVGTAAIAVAAVAGINVASSNATTVGDNSGRAGGPGVFGGPGSQGNGSQNGAPNGAPNGTPGGPGFGLDGDGDHGGGRGGGGTIDSVNGSTFTITTRDGGTTTVTTTADTTVTRTSRGGVSDLEAGDHVIVDVSGSGTALTAERIVDLGAASTAGPGLFPGGPGGRDDARGYGDGAGAPAGDQRADDGDHRFTAGTVESVNGSTVTITDDQGGTVTVATSTDTEISVEQSATVSDLAKGEQVMVRGQRASDGSITAADIHITG